MQESARKQPEMLDKPTAAVFKTSMKAEGPMNLSKKALLIQALGLSFETSFHRVAHTLDEAGAALRSSASRLSRSPFPKRIVRWFSRLNRLFIFTVLLPTLLAALYYGLIASNVYVSYSSFLVQSVQNQQQSSGLGSLLKSSSSGSSDEDSASVQEFMQSRDALRQLETEAGIRKAFANDGIDRLSRFGGLSWDKSFEALYYYYAKSYLKKVVTINPSEVSSSISEVQVRAFTAQDACRINRKLLEMGEKLVNALNERLQQDLVRFAEADVETARIRAEATYVALASYRNVNTLVDPEHQSSIQLQLILKLQEELIEDRNRLAQLNNSVADNPQIPVFRDRIKNLESEIGAEMIKATGDVGSLTNKASDYERLVFERDFAEKQLGEALSFLQRSRNEAQRKQLYLKRIVEPNTPDIAIEPKRIRNVLGVLVLGIVSWGIISLFVVAVREHQQ